MEKTNVQVNINTGEKISLLQAPKGRQLKGLLSDAGISFSYPCGGMGRCGKCKVKFLYGAPTPNALDMRFLSKKEMAEGVRLLCRCVLEQDAEIVLDKAAFNEEEIVANKQLKEEGKHKLDKDSIVKWGMAIDVGTTTIASVLLGINKDGDYDFFDLASTINHQRKYGTDVISRIAAACEGQGQKLRQIVCEDIARLIKESMERAKVKELDAITITGNTTMLHLLRGIDVSGLGQYPYKTGNIGIEKISAKELLGDSMNELPQELLNRARVLIMPGISAFVGADIVSGIYSLNLLSKKESALMMDLGTNGEMAFWDGEKLFVTSTAAGPVFEGCGISCGIPAVPGAINEVSIRKENDAFSARYNTIKGDKPKGLCGSGVLEAVSELVRNNIVDKTGLLTEEYFEKGFSITEDGNIRITQEDIRNVQLAKAALFVAQNELIKDKEPEYIFISGGYGMGLSTGKIKQLKMFPWEKKLTLASGNTALQGAFVYLINALRGAVEEKKADDELETIVKMAEVVELTNNSDFAENYVEAMNF